jgi:hypothetical protein
MKARILAGPVVRRYRSLSIAAVVCLALALAAGTARADGEFWSELPTSGTPPLGNGYRAIYDPVNHRKLVFSGSECYNMLCPNSLVWTLDLPTNIWSRAEPSGPTPPDRTSPAVAYDPVYRRMLVFGGGFKFTLNDVWELSMPAGGALSWSQIPAIGGPSPRFTSGIIDPVRNRFILFGGALPGANQTTNETWSLDLNTNTWSLLATSGTPPTPRSESGVMYDLLGDRMLVIGGFDGTSQLAETWALTLSGTPTWTRLAVSGPPPSSPQNLVALDSARQRVLMLVSGGFWELTLAGTPAWRFVPTSGVHGDKGLVYDLIGDRLLTESDYFTSNVPHRTWQLPLEDVPVPVLVAQGEIDATIDRVRLVWHAAAGALASADLERRAGDSEWRRLATLRPDGTGLIAYEDRDVAGGARYAYRLAWDAAEGRAMSPEVWVDIPRGARLALAIEGAQPTRGDLVVGCSLPAGAPARIEAFDLSGRRVLEREVGALGSGSHRVTFPGATLAPGVYTLLLTQGEARVSARAIVVR